MLYNENGHPVESAKQIHSISQPEQEKIEAFLQGCVYTWCNIHAEPLRDTRRQKAVSILGVINMKNQKNSAQPIL